jgi:hypothetical protein
MKNYKASVSKWTKRYNIIVKASNIAEAKDKIHKEWYTILSLKEVENVDIKWKKFYFDAIIDWQKKSWTIIWKDILKIYIKLVEDLKYNIVYLYDDQKIDEKQKWLLMNSLLEQYRIYKEKKLWWTKPTKSKFEKTKKQDPFFAQKTLEKTQKTIDFVIFKLEKILAPDSHIKLTSEKRETLMKLREAIIKIKKSTNIDRLKEVWEKALLKLWEIELIWLEQKKSQKYKDSLKETNSLLKQMWSRKQFIEKEKDIKFIAQKYFNILKEFFKQEKKEKKQKIKIDKTSHNYLKTLSLLYKYKAKLRETHKEMLKEFYVFLLPFWKFLETKDKLVLKRAVINQNISLLKNKIRWNKFSYTRVKKWYLYFLDKVLKFINFLKDPLLLLTLLYWIAIIIVMSWNYLFDSWLTFSKTWILYFIITQIFLIIAYFIRWLISLVLWVAFFWFIIIFLAVNF